MGGGRVFTMPDLGEGLEEGEIVGWLVAEGDTVALNQPLVEIETAKATVEVPSPFAGIGDRAARRPWGPTVPVGAPLVTFGGSAGRRPTAPTPAGRTSRQAPRRLRGRRRPSAGWPRSSASTSDRCRGRVPTDASRPTTSAAAGAATPATASLPGASIAQNLERQAAIPQVTTFRTVDCSALEAFRGELGVSPLPIVIAALCRTIGVAPLA